MKKEFVAYEGEELTIEWYFTDKGKSESLSYFDLLSLERKKKVVNLLRLLGSVHQISLAYF